MKYTNTESVGGGVLVHVINHGLNNNQAVLACATPGWPWMPAIHVVSRTADSITIGFSEVTYPDGDKLDVRVFG